MKWIDAPIHPTEESGQRACVSITAPTRKGVWSPGELVTHFDRLALDFGRAAFFVLPLAVALARGLPCLEISARRGPFT